MDLYRQEILEHMRSPRNFGKLDKPQVTAEAENTSCGDKVSLQLGLSDQGVIEEIGFEGAGCAITIASASMFTEAIKGKNVAEVAKMTPGQAIELMGIKVTPARVSCATVVLQAVREAVKKWDEEKK